jgi:hypothetical protein
MKKEISYSAKGHVLGNNWGGGKGSYPTILLRANTIDELLEKSRAALTDGSLDSGMGFEKLIGAVLDVTVITTIIFEDKEFTNEETETHIIGNLTEDEEEFLLEIY